MSVRIFELELRKEQDAVLARQLAMHVADLAQLGAQPRNRLATAVSEIARNVINYTQGGTVTCAIAERDGKQMVELSFVDDGPGIEALDRILAGEYRSRTGMGVGIHGSRNLVDEFEIETSKAGTRVRVAMRLDGSAGRLDACRIEGWRGALADDVQGGTVAILEEHGVDVIRMMRVLELRERELTRQLAESRRQVMELLASRDALREQATVDHLTGLHNRRNILRILDTELVRARRTGCPISVAMADLDHFKKLNDAFGHQIGDEALREAARRMMESLRPYDSVGRYGGEEFLFVLPDCDRDQGLAICERVRARMGEGQWTLSGVSVSVTASFGLCDDRMASRAEELIRLADLALYRAKACGRDRVEGATSDDVTRSRRATPR